MNNLDSSLLTINQASVFLNVKISRLRTAVLKREIPFIKMGRLLRFDKNDLSKWVEKLKEKTSGSSNPWFF